MRYKRIKNLTIVASIAAFSLLVSSTPSIAAPIASPLVNYMNKSWENDQWHLKAIKAQAAWTVSTGEGQIVAVIDTGVDGKHKDLKDNLVDGFNFVSSKNPDTGVTTWSPAPVKAADMKDEEGHGTHVSGLIAAQRNTFGVTGVAYSAKIMPIKVLDLLDYGKDIAVLEGLASAIDVAAANNADVINMSIGGASFELNADGSTKIDDDSKAYLAAEKSICTAITNAKNKGILTVIAAGNEGGTSNPASMPSNCDDAVSVAATEVSNRVTYFSSYNNTVDIAAPGMDILSTVPSSYDRNFRYAQFSGTSMASPITAGAIAVIQSAFPDYSVGQVLDRLYSTSTDAGLTGLDAYYGNGILNLSAAVGVETIKSNLSDTRTLVASLRYAYNFDGNSYTASWRQPLGSTLPNNYSVKVYDRYGGLYSSVIVDRKEVRYVFGIPSRFNRGLWVTVEANYDDETLAAPPIYSEGVSLPIAGASMEYEKIAGTDILSSATMYWNPMNNLDTSYISAYTYGLGMSASVTYNIVANEDGDYATSYTYNAKSSDFEDNTITSEFDIKMEIYNSSSNNQTPLFIIPASQALGVAKNDMSKVVTDSITSYNGKLATEIVLNDSGKALACKYAYADCVAAQFELTYVVKSTVTTKVKKKVVTKVVTKTYKVIPKTIYEYERIMLRQESPFKVGANTVSVTLTGKVIKSKGKVGEIVLPTKTLFENSSAVLIDCLS